MAIDAYRPFPMLLNKSINLAVVLEDTAKEADSEQRTRTAIVQLPAMLERFVQLPENGGLRKLLMLEDVIGFFIGKLFHGYVVKSTTVFRITRNADMTIHEEGARDLLFDVDLLAAASERGWRSTTVQSASTPFQSPRYSLTTARHAVRELLQRDGRMTFTQLAKRVSLSAPATTERVRRLEQAGALRVGADADGVANELAALLGDPARREQMAEAGLQSPDLAAWRTQAEGIAQLLQGRGVGAPARKHDRGVRQLAPKTPNRISHVCCAACVEVRDTDDRDSSRV